jgi:hypothetical protein
MRDPTQAIGRMLTGSEPVQEHEIRWPPALALLAAGAACFEQLEIEPEKNLKA